MVNKKSIIIITENDLTGKTAYLDVLRRNFLSALLCTLKPKNIKQIKLIKT